MVEVDPSDDSKFTRKKQIESKMADLVIMDSNLGSDTNGRRWLVSTMASTLLSKGFKGIIAVMLPENKKEAKQLLTSLSKFDEIHSLLTKHDSPEDLKVKIVLALQNVDFKGKIGSGGRRERDRLLKKFKKQHSHTGKDNLISMEERARRVTGDFNIDINEIMGKDVQSDKFN